MCNPAGEVRQLREKQCQFVPITPRSVNVQKQPYFSCALSGKSNLLGLVAQQQRSHRSGQDLTLGQPVRRCLFKSPQVESLWGQTRSGSFQQQKSKQSLGRRWTVHENSFPVQRKDF